MRTLTCRLMGALFSAWLGFAMAVDARDGEGGPESFSVPVTLGVHAGENEVFVQGDVLVPLYRYDGGLLFLNPRGTINDRDQEEVNLGVGVRHLFDARLPFILGGNVYYDGRWTRNDNRFDQLGIGVEFLSDRIDARANLYIPDRDTQLIETRQTESVAIRRHRETYGDQSWGDPYAEGHQVRQDLTRLLTTRSITSRETLTQVFERYEAALEGWDAEVGVRLPLFERHIQARVFGGYQYFDNPFGDTLHGWKGRVEVRALEGRLTLDAQWFENRDLNGATDYLVGARLRIPFEFGVRPERSGRGFGPADEAGVRLADRLDEMVMRDPKIQVQESGFIENEASRSRRVDRRVRVETEEETASVVLLDDVLFVDGDHGSSDGTAEKPFRTIQDAVDAAAGPATVYVFNASGPYAENVILKPEITLWGSGSLVPGYGGKSFGSGIHPRVIGGEAMPVVQMAAGSTVRGFQIHNMAGGDGIAAQTGERLVVADNVIWGNSRGLNIQSPFDTDVSVVLTGNRFEGNAAVGVDIFGLSLDPSRTFAVDATDNHFLGGSFGIQVRAEGYSSAVVSLDGIEVINASTGILVNLNAVEFSMLDVMNAHSIGHRDIGLIAEVKSDGFAMAMVGATDPGRPSSFNGGFASGLVLSVDGRVGAMTMVDGVEVNGVEFGNGITLTTRSTDGMAGALLSNIRASDNFTTGIRSLVEAPNGLAVGALSAFRVTGNRFGVDFGAHGKVALGWLGTENIEFGWHANASTERSLVAGNSMDGIVSGIIGDEMAMAAFHNLEVRDQGQRGINATIRSTDGVASAFFGSDPALPEAFRDAFAGDGSIGGGFAATMDLQAADYMRVSQNAQGGIRALVRGREGAQVLVAGLDASGNRSGPSAHGVGLEIESADGPVAAEFAGVTADGNTGSGILAELDGAEGFAFVEEARANGNDQSGIVLSVEAWDGAGDAVAGVRNVAATGNAGTDLRLIARTRAPGVPLTVVEPPVTADTIERVEIQDP